MVGEGPRGSRSPRPQPITEDVDLADYAEELHWTAVHLRAIVAGLEETRKPETSPGDVHFLLGFAIAGIGEYQELVERMLRDLDAAEVAKSGR